MDRMKHTACCSALCVVVCCSVLQHPMYLRHPTGGIITWEFELYGVATISSLLKL